MTRTANERPPLVPARTSLLIVLVESPVRIGRTASTALILPDATSEATEMAAECVSTNPASAALQEWFGENGIILAAALAGFVDTHSAAISVASLVASGKMTPADAVLPILAGLSTNTLSKLVLAGTSGGRSFAVRLMP